MKKVITIAGIVVLAALIVISGVLIVQIATREESGISLTSGGEVVTEAFSVENLLPGENKEKEYRINIEESGVRLGLTLEEGGESGLLSFLHVRVLFAQDEAYSGALSELLGKTLWTDAQGDTSVTVEYSLPLDTGNEAKGEKMDIKLTFTLSNEAEENEKQT